ncbi:MAG: sigma-70 family RNA polymerase sigma factor [Chlamydiae bacterium]|nr:sigma-70 family RNA polymerase sigma factor [Chlamydiota bacterium]MBI3276143.1 sigma-70 family RNA polymerase sigma factor [Chlamydiota bacterium]
MSEFESLAQEHFNSLYHTALRMTRNVEDAQDLVQETILKAFRHYSQFEKGTNFKAWIFRILTNSFINQYRKKSKEPPITDFTSIEPIYEEITKSTTQFSLGEIESLREKLSDEVKLALDKLPDEYRMVFLLSVIEDFSYQEISEILSCPVGTVMSRLFRARKILREELFNFAKKNGVIQRNWQRDGMESL